MTPKPRIGRLAATGLAVAMVAAGCAASAPTPIYVYVTPAPTPWIIYVTPAPTAMPTATPTPAETPSPATPATPKPTPTPAPGVAATSCTGSAENIAFISEAATYMPFDVYCLALPSNWFVGGGAYQQPNGGQVSLTYKTSTGGVIQLLEGNFCTSGASACAPKAAKLGSAALGKMTGELDQLDGAPTYVLYVNPRTGNAYTMSGKGMTQAQFTAWAAAALKVAKPK
jgi:hypothetical protein